jgi:Kef-type K+ transport system membrane component KefB
MRREFYFALNASGLPPSSTLTQRQKLATGEEVSMENVWFAAALWLGLAFLASAISIRLAISAALIEIIVGAVAGNTIGLQLNDWINFLAGFGAILLTFLAGSEIDPRVIRKHFGPSLGIGVVSFLAPSEAVLPAYLVGMALAAVFLTDHELPHRLRVIAFGVLTPFYFLKAGSC